MLQANDDFGQSYADTLTQLVKGTNLKIVQTQQYDSTGADVNTQVNSLAATQGRRVLPRRRRCSRARPRSRPRRTRVGTRSSTCRARACRRCCFARWRRRPTACSASRRCSTRPTRRTRSNPAMKLYKAQVAKYEPKADADRRHRRLRLDDRRVAREDARELAQRSTRASVMETGAHAARRDRRRVSRSRPRSGTRRPTTGSSARRSSSSSTTRPPGHTDPIGSLTNDDGKTASLTPSEPDQPVSGSARDQSLEGLEVGDDLEALSRHEPVVIARRAARGRGRSG